MGAYNTITISAHSSTPMVEGVASEQMYPGHLVDHLADGTYMLHKCGGAGGTLNPVLIVVENLLVGKKISDPYEAGEIVYYRHFRSGDICQVVFAPTTELLSGTLLKATGPSGVGTFINAVSHAWDSAVAWCHETSPADAVSPIRLVTAVVK